MLIRICLLTSALALSGCSGGDQLVNPAAGETENMDLQTPMNEHDTQVSNARIIQIDPPDGSTTPDQPPTFASEIQNSESLSAPMEQTVMQDGTILIDFGNRFMQPLTANADCDGDINQSHGQSIHSENSACDTESSQGEVE